MPTTQDESIRLMGVSTVKTSGSINRVNGDALKGWVISEDQSIVPEVSIRANSIEVSRVRANLFRKDLVNKEYSKSGNHGFEIFNLNLLLASHDLLEEDQIEIRALVSHNNYELHNSPILIQRNSTVPLYIFVHIPKTGGTSFRLAAKEKLSCIWDYGVHSVETSSILKQTIYSNSDNYESFRDFVNRWQITFLSGHFPASKYKKCFPDARYITFIRKPVDRIISEYNHAVRHGGYLESLEHFCKNPRHQNVLSKSFSGLGVNDFYFVGILEKYYESVLRFNELSGLDLAYLQANRASDKPRHALEVSVDDLDHKTIDLICEYNLRDLEFYEKAIKKLKLIRM